MEGLKKLEEIQRMLLFMESEGFISGSFSFTSSHSDSHRFLAQFLLFLMEPSGKLSIHNKCTLISQHLPKISPRFLEKALVVLPGEQTGILDDSLSVDLNREDANGGCHGLGTNYASADVALIGLDAMQRANSTLEDFCRSYFMFHGMDVKSPASIFKYLPMLSFTESFIYQLDTLNEKMVNVTMNKVIIRDGRSNEFIQEAYTTLACSFNKDFESDPFRPLTLLLQYHGLLTERIREELKYGEEYWDLERRLCGASEQVDDLHMEFLTVSEFLVEISDDLFDYEEDVLENNFNVLRMFIRIYGPSAAPTMLAKYITEAEEKYEKLSQALDPQICLSYQKRCEEATREGGKISGYSLGSWSIPPLIVDEELYRSSMQNSP
ncbi:uncharacterized protein LOC104895648 isoform X3 [Beta vulgaris subsp. vulgaris]|uniref:uncharacterized protein LOC104895648 isoform X3 n=1 Tax=Beta vulgaris subsp. vulgaris TaxID=3555 RepID=UPI0020373F64|nr:uncharacterized protein LOC104895648 isoform X3 [Beta vulgaris subsp. vulgaris]